ncbi:hypothetical protein WAI453_011937 [Rhynchosporium graminicola]
MNTPTRTPFLQKLQIQFRQGGNPRPVRLLKQDISNIRKRYISDWTLFNQLIFASAVYVLFTNILPGITFASDLYYRAVWDYFLAIFDSTSDDPGCYGTFCGPC